MQALTAQDFTRKLFRMCRCAQNPPTLNKTRNFGGVGEGWAIAPEIVHSDICADGFYSAKVKVRRDHSRLTEKGITDL